MNEGQPMVWTVDKYGWLWEVTDPTPAAMRKRLVQAWTEGKATDVGLFRVRGRRDVRI